MDTRIKIQFAGAAFGLFFFTTFSADGQGTIVYHDAGGVFLHSSGGDRNTLGIDMDRNGADDFVFEAFTSFRIYSTVGGRSVGIPKGGNDLGADSIPLLDGFEINSLLPAPLEWVNSTQGMFNWIGATLHTRNFTGGAGYWNPNVPDILRAFVGVEFDINGAAHYGWIDVTAGSIGNGGWINGWAYNTVPGEMILAGQVPEPSTWALLIGGGGFLYWRHRAKRKSRRAEVAIHASAVNQPNIGV